MAEHDLQAERLAQTGAAAQATGAYLELLTEAAGHPSSAASLDAAAAALDALVTRRSPALADTGVPHAWAFLQPGGTAAVRGKLEQIWQGAAPGAGFVRPLIAMYGLTLAMYDGDAGAAQTWRERSGCVRKAVVFGPIAPYGLAALASPLDLERPGVPLPAELGAADTNASPARAAVVDADSCALPLTSTSSRAGLRAVVVDVDVDRPQRVVVALTSRSAAAASAGGRAVLVRGFDAGGGTVTRVGAVRAPAGRLRVTARVALHDDGDWISLQVVGDDGLPLKTYAPAPGAQAPVAAADAPIGSAPATDGAALVLRANGLLALGEARRAGALLEAAAARNDASPVLLLTYARSLAMDSALPDARRTERMRDAYERARVSWPEAWEPAIGRAWLEGLRRGQSEARVQAIASLRGEGASSRPLVSVFEAAMAGRARLRDRAAEALGVARQSLGTAPALVVLDDLATDRGPADKAKFRCTTPGLDASSLDCHAALVEVGDAAGARAEVNRLRKLRGSPGALLALEATAAVHLGDQAEARRLYESLSPGQRFFSPLAFEVEGQPERVLSALERDLPFAPNDVSTALDLRIAATSSALREWDDRGARVVSEDRAHPAMPDAALLVLDHDELYEVSRSGVVYYVIHDVRRVSGTTDVEESEQSVGPTVDGVDAHRMLRRRVHKRDGRVIEPEAPSQAEQRNSDLSQLQPGDYVEQLLAGYAVAGFSGRFVIDTPDLMPERAGVRRARVVVRRPAGLVLERWAHPLFSAATATAREDGSASWAWELLDQPARRLESGVPHMDRAVRVTFGDSDWHVVAQSLADAMQSMKADDAVVAAFASQAAAGERSPSIRLLQNVVEAVGARVQVASGAVLSDTGAAMASGPQRATARTVLESGHGSRTWLAYEMLRSLGVASEVVAAEDEPFSASATFPAHQGRFSHPLLLVHLPAGENGGDVWLDLDVPGPPLPPGRVSAELRGRSALRVSGQLIPVPALSDDEAGDQIEVRLTVDERGDARGALVIQLRGRAAQALTESFQTTVGAARRDLLRSVVLAWIPRADVQAVDLSSKEGSWQVELKATIAVPGFAQPEGSRVVLPGILPLHEIEPEPDATTLTAEFAPEGERDSDLALDDAVRYELKRQIELPEGWVAVAPAEQSVTGERLRGTRRSEVQGRVIREVFELAVSTGTVPVEQVGQFTQDARRIDDTFLSGIRVDEKTTGRGEGKR